MHTKAIVRSISSNYKACISDHPEHNYLKVEKAIEQHKIYVYTLKELGLEIFELPSNDKYPDSCFVEDTAVIYKNTALITNMGAQSRIGEYKEIEPILSEYFTIKKQKHGTMEGGDVIHFQNYLISGITKRTSRNGIIEAEQLLNVKINSISNPEIVHLKSYVNYVTENLILTIEAYANNPVLKNHEKIIVPDHESYATNVLSLKNVIIMPEGFPITKSLLKENGFEIITLETSEFSKCEGALTCLSILF